MRGGEGRGRPGDEKEGVLEDKATIITSYTCMH